MKVKNVLFNEIKIKLKLEIKKEVVRPYVWSVLIYGCKVWTIKEKHEKSYRCIRNVVLL